MVNGVRRLVDSLHNLHFSCIVENEKSCRVQRSRCFDVLDIETLLKPFLCGDIECCSD
jgi:hypothetical protein